MPQANSSAEFRLHAAQRKDECGALCSCPALPWGRMWSPFSCGTQRAFRSGIALQNSDMFASAVPCRGH
jgi:hypothetical protein